MSSTIEESALHKEALLYSLKEYYHAQIRNSGDEQYIEDKFVSVISALEPFDLDMLPYSTASMFIYEIEIYDDVEYFFLFFKDRLTGRLEGNAREELVFKKALKMVEHLELANAQKNYLFNAQEETLRSLDARVAEVKASLEEYDKSKVDVEQKLNDFSGTKEKFDVLESSITTFENKVGEFEKNFTYFRDEFPKLETKTDQITVSLISILGIFASILLGAFGAIQGFNNVFANASVLTIGLILMLSAIGASAVLLILFFLMSSIARLTDKPYGNIEGTSFITRHPIMFFGHCILLIVFTAGGVIELIEKEITPQSNWLWIIIFVLVVIQVLFIYYTKSMWGIMRYFINLNGHVRETILYILIVILILIILFLRFG